MTDEPVLRIVRDPDDAFATFIMNRPDKLNALDLELLDALDTAVREAPDAPSPPGSIWSAMISRWIPKPGAPTCRPIATGCG
jgi:enoyl-CoA hydratase/carnithine racemase